MYEYPQFYINGKWVDPARPKSMQVIDPATEEAVGTISVGSSQDVDLAVDAARGAFATFGHSAVSERIDLLRAIVDQFKKRYGDIAAAISAEMGAPVSLATQAQAGSGIGHLKATLAALDGFRFEEDRGSTRIVREPIGVCGFITPWNWPINQITCKVAPALAAGCTMVLKPSEVAPLSACVFTEVMHDAGVPKGVYNMVNGEGPVVGAAMAAHPDIDMMSFTGSTRAGVEVARAAAPTVKRVAQELGGKSANIILDDVDLEKVITAGVRNCFSNSGQSCNAPTRMLVPERLHDEAVRIAKAAAESIKVGDPKQEGRHIGPVVSQVQYQKIQALIEKGIAEGAELVAGGPGKPEGMDKGYYVRPTIFANVNNEMTIAREEIFGPVLAILPYADEDDAVRIANDTPYGLAGYVSSTNMDRARAIAARLRTGMVHVNGAPNDVNAPFGGYKQSGNGREWGPEGIEEFLETKSIFGYAEAS